MNGTNTVRLLPVIVVSTAASACTEWSFVNEVEWNVIDTAFSLLIAVAGFYIGYKVRLDAAREKKLEEERAAREKKMDEERAAREKKLEEERAAREKKMEKERAERQKRMDKERAAREKRMDKERVTREKRMHEKRVAQEKQIQEQRDRLQAFDGYRRELRRFADTVIDVMVETQALIEFDPRSADVRSEAKQRFFDERSRLISRASSLLDQGHLFFPNADVAGVGEHGQAGKEESRDPVLNRIMAVKHVLMATDYVNHKRNREARIKWPTLTEVTAGDDRHVFAAFQHLSLTEQKRLCNKLSQQDGIELIDLIVSARRAFVSEMSSIIQPASWLKQVEDAYGIKLLSREPEVPTVYEAQQLR